MDKNEELTKLYNVKQWAYKILANALYGVLGNFAFRFFKLDLASSVTMTGREAIQFAGYHCNKFMETNQTEIDSNFLNNYDDINLKYILYTDTDSLFVGLCDWLMDKKNLKLV